MKCQFHDMYKYPQRRIIQQYMQWIKKLVKGRKMPPGTDFEPRYIFRKRTLAVCRCFFYVRCHAMNGPEGLNGTEFRLFGLDARTYVYIGLFCQVFFAVRYDILFIFNFFQQSAKFFAVTVRNGCLFHFPYPTPLTYYYISENRTCQPDGHVPLINATS